jgi:hypothetical protein
MFGLETHMLFYPQLQIVRDIELLTYSVESFLDLFLHGVLVVHARYNGSECSINKRKRYHSNQHDHDAVHPLSVVGTQDVSISNGSDSRHTPVQSKTINH